MTVPLDYADPKGETITIEVARSVASDSQGSVVINPGGPGASGIDMVEYVAQAGGAKLAKHLDVVGFDPRGVGASTAIDCVDDETLDEIVALDVEGATDEGRKTAAEMFTELGEGCLDNTGDLLAHVDTISSARDMDVLRAALGENTLTYLGFSYGTELGATYAALFPDKVGQFVLDGAVDPTLSALDLAVGQAGGFESAMRAYVADCQQAADCPLTGTVDDGMAQIGEILERARVQPYPTDSDRALTASLAFTGVALPMYSVDYWPSLTDALKAAKKGNGAGLLFLSDVYADRDPDGTYVSNSMEAFWAIGCADGRGDADPAAMEAEAEAIKAAAPTIWEFFSYSALLCDTWPTPAVDSLDSYAAEGAPPILVIGTSNDPATPYAWSESLANTLSSGVLVTRNGEGHTAYLSGNTCINKVVDDFLVDGVVPADGTVC